MLDHKLLPALMTRMVEITDHVALGEIVADWATGARPLPTSPRALRQQLAGIAIVGAAVREVVFDRPDPGRLMIRLPDASGVEAACDAFADPWAGARYPLPRFYIEAVDPEAGAVLSPLDVMHARIADHAIAQCL